MAQYFKRKKRWRNPPERPGEMFVADVEKGMGEFIYTLALPRIEQRITAAELNVTINGTEEKRETEPRWRFHTFNLPLGARVQAYCCFKNPKGMSEKSETLSFEVPTTLKPPKPGKPEIVKRIPII